MILDIGTNDVSSYRTVAHIARDIVDSCQYWLEVLDFVKSITWCHITPRNQGIKNVYSQWNVRRMNRRASSLNRIMARAARRIAELHHLRHKGISRAGVKDMADGIHPTSEGAIWKYQKSIARACRWSKTNLY